MLKVLKKTYSHARKDDIPRLAAALAYYSIFSLTPFLILTVTVAGFFLSRSVAEETLITQIGRVTTQETATRLSNFLTQARTNTFTGINIVLLFTGATTLFFHLQQSLNHIFEARSKGFMKVIEKRAISFLIAVLSGLMLIAATFLDTIFASIRIVGSAGYAVNMILSVAVITGIFSLLYKYLPDAHLRWHAVLKGSLLSAILITFGKFFLGLYISQSNFSSTYGAAGSLMAILIWIYFIALVLFAGAEFTKACQDLC